MSLKDNDELKAQENSTRKRLGIRPTRRPSKFDATRTVRELLHHCAELGMYLEHACELTGLHHATIERYLTRYYNTTYAKFRKQKMGLTSHMLIKRAMDHALLADEKDLKPAVLIFLLKNYCGMTDKPPEEKEEDSNNNTIILNYNLDKEPGEYRDVTQVQDNKE